MRIFRIAQLVLLSSLAACLRTGPEWAAQITPIRTPPTGDWWHPDVGLSWQWQLDGEIELDVPVEVIDLDLDVDPAVVEEFHRKGIKVICYISVGSFEDWRSDASLFPPQLLGKDYAGWSGEKWLDIRRIDLLSPIMMARLDRCASKGFDAVEPDNLEISASDSGFALTVEDQLRYALWLAAESHHRGLAIGQKNAPDLAGALVETYDFAITEDAFSFGWAEHMRPYIQAGKPVFAAEYSDQAGDFSAFCQRSKELGFSTILKKRDLGAWLEACQ